MTVIQDADLVNHELGSRSSGLFSVMPALPEYYTRLYCYNSIHIWDYDPSFRFSNHNRFAHFNFSLPHRRGLLMNLLFLAMCAGYPFSFSQNPLRYEDPYI